MVNGLVRCVHPGIDKHVSFGTVLTVGYDALLKQSYMDVEDLEGRVLNAIKEYGCDLTVLGNYGNSAPGTEPVTSGHWDDIAYDSLTDTTTFTDFSATFPPQAANWWLQPDAARSTYLEIVSISASQVVVEGDATGLAHGLIPQPGPPPLPDIIGTFYTIVWPAGVDPATGTLAHNNPCEPISRLLFAGYYYMPPVAGTKIAPDGTTGTTTYGQQPGGNHHGDYYCWNRVYAQKNGVWTTTDPAVTPWTNLGEYVRANPICRSDPNGLGCKFVIYDNVDDMAPLWWGGGVLWAGVGYISKGASGWGSALTQLRGAYIDNGCCCIEEIQIWGHGNQGESLLGGKALSVADPFVTWVAGNWCQPDNEGIWFRQCEVAGGVKGKKFMEDAANAFKAKVTAHTHVIAGPDDQPGKKTLKPGEKAGWTDTEGGDSWVELPSGKVHETGRVKEAGNKKTKLTGSDTAIEIAKILVPPVNAVDKAIRLIKWAWGD